LPQLRWPTRHKTGFHQQELSQQLLGFRTLSRRALGFRNRLRKLNQRPLGFTMLNWQQLGFRVHTLKLNRRSFGFRKLNRRQLGLKAHEHLVTCNQHNMHQGGKFERHPPELSSHVKFSKLNRSLRLGFRTPELQTMIESGNIKERRIATRYHRSLAGTSGCSRPLQLLKQRKFYEIYTSYRTVVEYCKLGWRPSMSSTPSMSSSSSTIVIEQIYIERR